MSIEGDGKYHGQEYLEGQDAAGVPEQADESDASGEERGPGAGFDISEYSRVVITGNFGAFCAQNQVLTFHNITLAQARKRKWDYFGMCPSVMTCYDQSGKPVHEES